ncbi:MAG: aldo/keto reductase [Rhizobiaceae bacterium]|nr:aldo/keto reductase [Rhizobiaceae bacterium]
MERVKIADGLEFSRIVYGTWRLGDDSDTSAKHIQAKIESCLEQGITTIDQADIYGGYTAEALLGSAFKAAPSLREKLEIVTKCGIVAPAGRYSDARVKYYDTSADHIRRSIEHSLKEMSIETIDLLLIHRPDPFMDHHETGGALDEAVASGKVRTVGVSNFRPYDFSLLQSAMKNRLVTNQIELSLQCHEPFVNGDVAYLQERDLSPMAWSPLGGGQLFSNAGSELTSKIDRLAKANGVDAASIAIAWLLAHPAKILPVMGTNRLDRIALFSDAMKVGMDRETWFELYTAALGREVA